MEGEGGDKEIPPGMARPLPLSSMDGSPYEGKERGDEARKTTLQKSEVLQNMLKVSPAAKINLYLRIRGKRSDGYHLVESELQTVDLRDELTVERSPRFILACSGEPVPCGEENLVARAFRLFREKIGAEPVKIHLHKRIPPGRGLGGGSSDAAATLLALGKLFAPDLTMEVLLSMAVELGADVPFFLLGGRVKVEGIGEKLQPLKDLPGVAVVVDPGLEVSTAKIYEEYDKLREKGFDFTPYSNHLLPALLSLHPELHKFREWGMELSGSGSCFFKTFAEVSEARSFYGKISSGRKWVVNFVPFVEYQSTLIGE